ncbi:Myb domain protein [Klebsormidium nitens]|uniref:Myb domain protein n=1 Tax=Klebsormidium nitens TaxID=105231 RepID=A0A1Y1ILQ0_KLENI|nr:Myb domain protein [Klebsormidium nitens]|eukprot:GAQ91815.1 Myb domain protein [Klebsormidium nitens]
MSSHVEEFGNALQPVMSQAVLETWDAWFSRLKAGGCQERGSELPGVGGGDSNNARPKALGSQGGGAEVLSRGAGDFGNGGVKGIPEGYQGPFYTMGMGKKVACVGGIHTSGGAECEKAASQGESTATHGGVLEPDSASDSDVLVKLRTGKNRTKWAKEEDAILAAFVGGSPETTDWEAAARALLGKRSAKKCRHRWRTALDPQLASRKWTPEEEHDLRALHQEHGNRWAAIAEKLPGRSQAAIKAHWKEITAAKKAAMTTSPAVCSVKKAVSAESGPPPERPQALPPVKPSPAEKVLPRLADGPMNPTAELRFHSAWARSLAAEWRRNPPATLGRSPTDPLDWSKGAGAAFPYGQGGVFQVEVTPQNLGVDAPSFASPGSEDRNADLRGLFAKSLRPLSPRNSTSQLLTSQLSDLEPLDFDRVIPKPVTPRRSLSVPLAPHSAPTIVTIPVRMATSLDTSSAGWYRDSRREPLLAPERPSADHAFQTAPFPEPIPHAIRTAFRGMQPPSAAASAEAAAITSGFGLRMTSAAVAVNPREQAGVRKRKRASGGSPGRCATETRNGTERNKSSGMLLASGGPAQRAMYPPGTNDAILCALLSDHLRSLVEEQGADLELGCKKPGGSTPPDVFRLREQHSQMRSIVQFLQTLIGGSAAGGLLAKQETQLEAPRNEKLSLPPESGSETRNVYPDGVNTRKTLVELSRAHDESEITSCLLTLERLSGNGTGAGVAYVPVERGSGIRSEL